MEGKMFYMLVTVTHRVWLWWVLGAQGIVGCKMGRKKRCHIYMGYEKTPCVILKTLHLSASQQSPPILLVCRQSHPLFKYYFKPPLNSQQCGNICFIPHLHDFLQSNEGNSIFLFLSQQVGDRKCASLKNSNLYYVGDKGCKFIILHLYQMRNKGSICLT